MRIQIDPLLMAELQKIEKTFAAIKSDPRIVKLRAKRMRTMARIKELTDCPSMAELLFPAS